MIYLWGHEIISGQEEHKEYLLENDIFVLNKEKIQFYWQDIYHIVPGLMLIVGYDKGRIRVGYCGRRLKTDG